MIDTAAAAVTTALTDQALMDFCARHGLPMPLAQEPIVAGRNSKVTRLSNLSNDGRQWILKQYYPQGPQERDRLGVEFAFLQSLQRLGVATVAQPIGMDRALHSALYSPLPGQRPEAVTADLITQAAQFIAAINVNADALAPAADACVAWQDHLALTRVRLTQLMAMTPQSALEEQAHALVAERFMPLWKGLESSLNAQAQALPQGTQILSPSDFGFHNTLAHRGRLSFVDFEYAGWDDAAKLICDFICQPALPISAAQGAQFVTELQAELPQLEAIGARVERLLPVHRLKWCCILLNEFRPEYRQRRIHAGLAAEDLQATQLLKASDYFDSHLTHHSGIN
ncbi:MAG TPA: hypothetical protein VNX00_06785 [Herbaspirillum sp.]|jgi:hypothetical protein|nr:hypothetical protein [Herbaspirillum sp.]